MQRLLSILMVLALLHFSSCDESDPVAGDILLQLQTIPGATVTELTTEDHFNRLFEIWLEQPVDHNAPNGATFLQKLYVGHVDVTLPVSFETEGYARSSHRTRELAPWLGINQLTVEHRYYGESVPSPIEWPLLDVWQAANDHHRVVELFKEIYEGKWVSSGASKGGDCAVFHRRFFPGDVDATLVYGAPILFEQNDSRYLDYYNTAGDAECRQKMKNYQREMLMHMDEFDALFEDYVEFVNTNFGVNFQFTLPWRDIVYHSIREDYAFEFWSSDWEDCSTIPEEDATLQQLFDHYVGVFDIFLFFSDYGVDFWTPYVYQALTELGNYAWDLDHLEDLEADVEPLVEYNVPTEFNPGVMADIDQWVRTSIDNAIFIYGYDDPWRVAEFNLPASDNVFKYLNPFTKHSTRIADLPTTYQNEIRNNLEDWLDL